MSLARFLGAGGSRNGFNLCVGKQADEEIYVVIDGCGLSDPGSRRMPGRSNTGTGSGEPVAASSGDEKKPDVAEKAKELEAEVEAKVGELAEKIDQNESAKEAAEGVLGPIYKLAESLNFSSFHWLAFGLMSAGVVSFALQLVLGKLVVLFKGSINLREIISDAIGFVISTVGLVLTTQAAAENSTFTHSPAAVLSSAACGVVLGVMLYRWGQIQEVNAVAGQRVGQPSRNQSKS